MFSRSLKMYDQEMPLSYTTDHPIAPRGRDTEHLKSHDGSKAASSLQRKARKETKDPITKQRPKQLVPKMGAT